MKFLRGLCLLIVLLLLPALSACLAEDIPGIVPSPAPEASYSLLKTGSSGEAVRNLQKRLSELGYDVGEVDGIFGAGTKHAVILFQKRNGLDADGLAGAQTQRALYAQEAVPAPEPPVPVDVLSSSLPMLVNKEHPVNENFLPADLVFLRDVCPSDLVRIKYDSIQGVRSAVEALIRMLEGARDDGITKWQVSAGYRSYMNQVNLLNSKIDSYLKKNSSWSTSRARSAALKTVAEPGSSEHHLGLAFDINVPGTSSFISTKQCKWLHAHCWEYGFIIRYQKGKEELTGFSAEAWHIRYVGEEHSLPMLEKGLCLEEYLEQMEGEIVESVELD